MRIIVFVFTLFLLGVSAMPEDTAISSGQGRIVTNNIERAINAFCQRIEDAGLDPLHIDLYRTERITPIGRILLWIEKLLFTGLSNIQIDNLSYTVTTSRLRLNLVMPRIALQLRSAGVEVNLLGRSFEAEIGGSLEILGPRIIGDIRFSVGVISGITVRSVDMAFELEDIKSDLTVFVQNEDLSDKVNTYLGETIPKHVKENQNDINTWLTDVTHTLLNRIL